MLGLLISLLLIMVAPALADTTNSLTAVTSSLSPDEIVEFSAQPASVQKLISLCLDLTHQHLAYTTASADPSTGGMDCSGFVYFVLQQAGFKQVPRDSSGQYVWVRMNHSFHAVFSRKANGFETAELLPGDLMFWTGTYQTTHDPPVSHVMIYLGTEKSTGNRIMVGSSDGRTYHGEKRSGVSVFDFVMPRAANEDKQQATFIGYGGIPELRDSVSAAH